MSAHRDLHALATGVHAALVTLHLLGLGYALVRKHRYNSVIHLYGAVFSARAVRHHVRACGQ